MHHESQNSKVKSFQPNLEPRFIAHQDVSSSEVRQWWHHSLLNTLFFCVVRLGTAWLHLEPASIWACWARSLLFVAAGDRRQCYSLCCYGVQCLAWSYLKSRLYSKASCWWLRSQRSCLRWDHPCFCLIDLGDDSPGLRRRLCLPSCHQPSDYFATVPTLQYSSATVIEFYS